MKRMTRTIFMAIALLGMALGQAKTAWSLGQPSEIDMIQKWETITIEELASIGKDSLLLAKNLNKKYRLYGKVQDVTDPNPSLGTQYIVVGSEGGTFLVSTAGERPLGNEIRFITGTLRMIKENSGAVTAYLSEAFVWNYYPTATRDTIAPGKPSQEDLTKWAQQVDYEFAAENSFRRFFVKNRNGDSMNEFSPGEWESRGQRPTRVLEIENFLKQAIPPPQPPPICSICGKLKRECGEIHPQCSICGKYQFECKGNHPLCDTCGKYQFQCKGKHPLCPDCGKYLFQCKGEHPLCPVCGKYQYECKGIHPPKFPMWLWGVVGAAAFVLLLLVILLATRKSAVPPPPPPQPIAAGVPPPPPPPPPKPSPADDDDNEKTEVDFESTMVLSPYALKVISGGTSAGQVHSLPWGETLIGRGSKDKAPVGCTSFLHLDMSDRPSEKKFCSRHYAKVSPSSATDTLLIEVVNSSGNAVTVDGKEFRDKNATTQAHVGSRIRLNPDWEFEVVKRG